MKKRFLAILAAVLLPSCLFAQFGVVSPLHVNGNQLNDAYGNKVVLHGDGYTESLLQQISLGV